ncbi:type II secretion system F family protein [Candidatus Odyssella thessalonicensis]|uniref:type II secretion system F family protein n=1 Tax=Candidatus Odyssella thessalonicensis TaxID=84647 RepID=UPI000225AEEF|nr:type II secretion system F family protein [Candidatus Odyssella thessalonicensis]
MRRKVSLSEQILCWQTLAHLTHSRMPLYQALEVTKDVINSSFLKGEFNHLQSELINGKPLSQSLLQRSGIGSCYNSQMVALAEKTGDYAKAFNLIAQHLIWRRSWQQLLQHSLRYPIFLVGLLGLLFCIIILFVLPGLMDQLALVGIQDIPLSTQLLIAVGQHPSEILGGGLISFLLLMLWRQHRHRKGLKPWRYSLPGAGKVLYRLQFVQFLHALGIMLTARIDVMASLYYASQTPTCAWLRTRLQTKEHCLIAGDTLSVALQDLIPGDSPTAALIKVAERTGQLGPLLASSSEAEQGQLQLKLKSWLDLLQPTLVVVMGMLMVWVVLAVLLPLYESIGQIHG